MNTLWIQALLIISLGGCALVSPTSTRESTQVAVHSVLPPTHHEEPVHPLLAEVVALSREQAEAEWLEVLTRFERDREPLDLTRLGLLTLVSRPNRSRDGRVVQLLRRGVASHSPESDIDADLVELLLLTALTQRLASDAQLLEGRAQHQIAAEQLQSLQGSLKARANQVESLQAALAAGQSEKQALAVKFEEERQKFEEERQKVEALRGQLEQLKAIERIIDRREDAGTGQGGAQ